MKSASIWDFWAAHYNRLWVQKLSLGPTRLEIIRRIPEYDGIKILDVGCGTGQLFGDLKETRKTSFDYTGIDASEAMLGVARSDYPEADFETVSLAECELPAGGYDVIVCAHAFPYFSEKERMFRKLKQLLKEDGILLIAHASTNTIYDAAMLLLVKLTTTRAHYPSCRWMRELAKAHFSSPPEESRIGSSWFIPSIYLFKLVGDGEGGT